MISVTELTSYVNGLLEVSDFKDYCPNGLQVQGRPQIEHLVAGVTASQALIEAAIDANADAILVHHGYFWHGEDPCITGIKYQRIKRLLEAGVSLLAYHLPLDAHPVFGNNAQLALKLGLIVDGRFGEAKQPIAMHGHLASSQSVEDFCGHIASVLNRSPLYIGEAARKINTVAWCTGAAQSYINQAVELGVDAFITGEVSEQTVHIAREAGIVFIAAGHHATERYGAQALGTHLAENFALSQQFIDIENPV